MAKNFRSGGTVVKSLEANLWKLLEQYVKCLMLFTELHQL